MESDESATGPYVAVALRQFEKGKAPLWVNSLRSSLGNYESPRDRHRLDQLRSALLAANDLSPLNLLLDMGGTGVRLRDTLSTTPRLLTSFSVSQLSSGAS